MKEYKITLVKDLHYGTRKGKDIISCEGKIYSPDSIGLTWNGKHYAMFSSNSGMSTTELKGDWKIKGE